MVQKDQEERQKEVTQRARETEERQIDRMTRFKVDSKHGRAWWSEVQQVALALETSPAPCPPSSPALPALPVHTRAALAVGKDVLQPLLQLISPFPLQVQLPLEVLELWGREKGRGRLRPSGPMSRGLCLAISPSYRSTALLLQDPLPVHRVLHLLWGGESTAGDSQKGWMRCLPSLPQVSVLRPRVCQGQCGGAGDKGPVSGC